MSAGPEQWLSGELLMPYGKSLSCRWVGLFLIWSWRLYLIWYREWIGGTCNIADCLASLCSAEPRYNGEDGRLSWSVPVVPPPAQDRFSDDTRSDRLLANAIDSKKLRNCPDFDARHLGSDQIPPRPHLAATPPETSGDPRPSHPAFPPRTPSMLPLPNPPDSNLAGPGSRGTCYLVQDCSVVVAAAELDEVELREGFARRPGNRHLLHLTW